MRLRRPAIALAVSVAVAGLPASAGAVIYAPPGKAGASEYFETLPASGGNVAPPSGSGSSAPSKIGAAAATVPKLKKLGKNGQDAAALAEATAPVPAPAPAAVRAKGKSYSAVVAGSGGSALSGITHLLGGADVNGIGAFLPLLLAFGLGAAVAYSVLRGLRARRPSAS